MDNPVNNFAARIALATNYLHNSMIPNSGLTKVYLVHLRKIHNFALGMTFDLTTKSA